MKSTTAISDEEQLVAGCKAGKTWAQKGIFERYASAMMSVCVRYVPDRETARDLLQDGFIKLYTKIDTYSGDGSFGGWVRRIFVTTALEYLRQNDVLKQSDSIEEYSDSIQTNDLTILDKLSADDLMGCVAKLPDGYRTVFNLYAIEGYSHTEIAEMLEITESTSRTQFMRARKLLQKNVQALMEQTHAGQYK
ncbi:MAG: sigma-70 family RNA polymerase sigma factor [Bacteroidota bacterium]|nr:sigma-70 family RNA polymerase sigma factor [Bacteroidota bacterium]